jgi:EmrB/QacA subfamily drug resistance transporter
VCRVTKATEITHAHPQRWKILAILNLSLVLIVASVSSLNLAIPSIQRALNATASELVWINAAYALVFAGLLLPAGALGDRYGRKRALVGGLTIFLVSALIATLSENATQLIVLRGAMGIGAALTMPATLSIITVVFPREERAKAIAIWSGFAGAGGALGILASGFLLESFKWSSVFFINVPIAALAIILVIAMVPNSKDPQERPLDPAGSLLSIVGLVAFVYGLIQGPEFGWTDPIVLGAFAVSILAMFTWVRVGLAHHDPLLDPRLFRIPKFRMGSFTITSAFLVMFGMFFVLTQYLQFALGYTPLEAAIRTLPFAPAMILIAPRGPALAAKIGAGKTMALGMLTSTAGLFAFGFMTVSTPYLPIGIALVVAAGGLALVFPTATESIVSSLPQNKAGVASAMNDATREVGGAIGIALLGTLLSSGYRSGLGNSASDLPPEAADVFQDNVGAALAVAEQLPNGEALAAVARDAFVDGMQLAMWAGAAVMLISSVIVFRLFPREETPAIESLVEEVV